MTLYDIAIDLFSYLTAFRLRLGAGVKPAFEEVQRDLLRIFRDHELKVRQTPGLAASYDQVRYVLVVFADEVILNSEWEYAKDWEGALLECRFFDTDVGGDRFFELCEELEMRDLDVASIYYTCLSLGFRGKYEPDAEELQLLRQTLLEKCSHPAEDPQAPLCPQAYAVRTRKIRKLPSMLSWRQIPILLIAIFGICLVLDRVIIWNRLTTPLREVRALATERLAKGELPFDASLQTAPSRPLQEPGGFATLPSISEAVPKNTPEPAVSPDVREEIDLSVRKPKTGWEAAKELSQEAPGRKSAPTSGYAVQAGSR